jgi:AraC-like DNA-binding protein
VLVLLIRCAIDRDMIAGGVLFAMLDMQLEKVLNAIHVEPERDWTLVQMAEAAGMSRSAFSAHFTKLVGVPPISYLTAWRMKLAQDMMRQGIALKIVASSVGYSSQAAFSRAFVHEVGVPPAEWLKRP